MSNESTVEKIKPDDISFNPYVHYSSDNYGAHALCFIINETEFYFSYKTLVGIRGYDRNGNYRFACLRNYWGPTTGKHLNAIQPDKSKRLSQDDFDVVVSEIVNR